MTCTIILKHSANICVFIHILSSKRYSRFVIRSLHHLMYCVMHTHIEAESIYMHMHVHVADTIQSRVLAYFLYIHVYIHNTYSVVIA